MSGGLCLLRFTRETERGHQKGDGAKKAFFEKNKNIFFVGSDLISTFTDFVSKSRLLVRRYQVLFLCGDDDEIYYKFR